MTDGPPPSTPFLFARSRTPRPAPVDDPSGNAPASAPSPPRTAQRTPIPHRHQSTTVVDTFTRYSPVIDPRFTYRSENVVEALDQACARLGYSKAIRVDQGTEFVSRNLHLWAYAHGVTLDFSRPGKLTDNAFIEGFNGRFRAECLNAHWFPDACGCGRKVGGLGAETTWGHRQQAADSVDESR
jgi:transposase InsO family protein